MNIGYENACLFGVNLACHTRPTYNAVCFVDFELAVQAIVANRRGRTANGRTMQHTAATNIAASICKHEDSTAMIDIDCEQPELGRWAQRNR